MRDADAVEFLQWALPRLGLRWRGFRKVRGQVRKRLSRRLAELAVPDLAAYRERLADDLEEWRRLDSLCRISISRFHRDRAVFEALVEVVLPALAVRASERGDATLRCWSAGCASGEEPYSVAIAWTSALAPRFPELTLDVVASDADEHLLERARTARYPRSSVRETPAAWQAAAFDACGGDRVLRASYRDAVRFEQRDIRESVPAGTFDLVLCRNLAFTYFDVAAQRRFIDRLDRLLVPRGALGVGLHETLPPGAAGWSPWPGLRSVFVALGN